MAHPFSRMFEKVLSESTEDDNLVLEEAESLVKKGYKPEEIHEVLVSLAKGLIDDTEAMIVREAAEEISRYLDGE